MSTHDLTAQEPQPEVLARGPWPPQLITASWADDHFQAPPDKTMAADAAIAALRARGSPSHDGLSARLVGHRSGPDGLQLRLQPARWALRLSGSDACDSVAGLCLIRSSDGRWLAGRRAPWLATWAGRWALGAGGAVDLGENPTSTLSRELREEWSVSPARLQVEALIRLPHRLVMFVGQAWLAEGQQVVPDAEHDEHAWWPADVRRWPDVADDGLRTMARWLDP